MSGTSPPLQAIEGCARLGSRVTVSPQGTSQPPIYIDMYRKIDIYIYNVEELRESETSPQQRAIEGCVR